MAELTVKTITQSYVPAPIGNGYTVFVPGIVHNLPEGQQAAIYALLTTKDDLDKYYVDETEGWTKSSEETATYNYVLGLIYAGYSILFKPITDESGNLVTKIINNSGSLAGTALYELSQGHNMDIADPYLYQVDFITDGGLSENIMNEIVLSPTEVTEAVGVASNNNINLTNRFIIPGTLSGTLTKYSYDSDPDTIPVPTPIATETIKVEDQGNGSVLLVEVNKFFTIIYGDSSEAARILSLGGYYKNGTGQDDPWIRTSGSLTYSYSSDTDSSVSTVGTQIYSNLTDIANLRKDCVVIPGLYAGCSREDANKYLVTLLGKDNLLAPYAPGFKIEINGKYPEYEGIDNYWMDGAYIFLVTLANAMSSGANVYLPPAGVNRMVVPNNATNPQYEVGGSLLKEWQDNSITVSDDKTPVNPIMNIPNYGYTVFGQRSMDVATTDGKVTVLRNASAQLTCALVYKAIFNVGLSITFDQNVVNTWTKFKTRLGSILQSIQNSGGLTDYLVVMDETTTTQEDLLANRLNGEVYIAIPGVVESIQIKFYVEPQTVTFTGVNA